MAIQRYISNVTRGLGLFVATLLTVARIASAEEPLLQPGLGRAADFSAVYPTNAFPAGTHQIVGVFQLPSGRSFKDLTCQLVAVDVGSAAPPDSSVAVARAELTSHSGDRGSFQFVSPRAFPAGRYRMDVTGDGQRWKPAEFSVAAASSDTDSPLSADRAIPLSDGHSWTYDFLLESGRGVHLTLDNFKPGADGKFRGTVTERVLGHDAAGIHVEARLGPSPLEEWWQIDRKGFVITQRKIQGEMFVVDPPQLFLPWPPKTPQSWDWRAKDRTIGVHQTSHMWGPVPVAGPNGPTPGFVVLIQEQNPDGPTVTFERHYLPGFGKVREVLVEAVKGELVLRQELTLKK